MSIEALLSELQEKGVQIHLEQGELAIRAPRGVMSADLAAKLKQHKAALLSLATTPNSSLLEALSTRRRVTSMRSRPRLTPEMLTLVSLTQEEIDRILVQVPGGAANIQDIYPLAPLQSGILFHHLLQTQGDTYLSPLLLAFDSRERLERFAQTLNQVIARHDVLRTAVFWEGLSEPVQVVWRHAPFELETLDAVALARHGDDGDTQVQLMACTDPRHTRLDIRKAPLLRGVAAHDAHRRRWLLQFLHHHLVMDHTTTGLMIEEIALIQQGRHAELAPPMPFRNFVAQARLGVDRAEHEGFFREQLGDIDEPTAPFGVLDVQGDGSTVREERLDMEPELSRRIRRQARQAGVSVASIFHLAYALVLAKTTSHENVVFGTVLLGRMQAGAGADRVMGMFINTLPLCVRLGKQSAAQALQTTHKNLIALLQHEHASLVLAQRCSALPAPTPLFSALLNYRYSQEKQETSNAVSDAFSGVELIGGEERTNFPFTLSVDDLGEGFSLTAQVIEPISAGRICGLAHAALETLLAALERSPEVPISMLDILPEEERNRVLNLFNDTRQTYPEEALIHELFEQQVRLRPEAIAVEFEGQRLSYGELNVRANRVAYQLLAMDVKPDSRVAIYAERNLQMLIGLLAILKAGGAYVPMDPCYPEERLRYMVKDAKPVALLTQRGLLQDVAGGWCEGLPIVDLDSTVGELSSNDRNPSISSLNSRNLAYVIYTSGSTGMPKGVMVEHRGVVNLLSSMDRALRIEMTDRVLALTTIAFDIAGLELFLPLVCGASIALVSRRDATDPSLLQERVLRLGVTVMQATPATWRMLLDSGWRGGSHLRVLCGGEALTTDLSARLRERVGELWNVYGPTETTIWSAAWLVREPSAESSLESIGSPVANTRIYILDARRQPVPIGVSGELYISGAGVARGYLERPDLTVERFMEDPFVSAPGARMYKTGDLGRWAPNGSIEFLGRNDFQLKIRGFRIELGEIEAMLRQHPEVREAVVIAQDDASGNKQLVAYLTSDCALGTEELRRHLASSLPDYMVPTAFVRLDTLPLTPNGKLDRKALPRLTKEAFSSRTFEAPRGYVETTVAAVWADVLRLDRVGRHDNFFELGGNSLLLPAMTSQLGRHGFPVGIADVFRYPTLVELVSWIGLQRQRASAHESGAREIRGSGAHLPLFLVHEYSGFDFYFSALSEYLDRELPIYGLPGVPLDQHQPHTMQALAQRMVGLIRGIQAEGPYRLAGWSFGGVLAYEVAVQLAATGATVEFLGLLDSEHPDLVRSSTPGGPRTPNQELLHWCRTGATAEPNAMSDLAELGQELGFEALFARCRELMIVPAYMMNAHASDVLKYARRRIAHHEARANYTPPSPSFPVHLFLAESSAEGDDPARRLPSLGWERTVPAERLTVIPVPGTHMTMMERKQIVHLGRAIDAVLLNRSA